MIDIFDAKISCKECDKTMMPTFVEKSGLKLRAVECPSCKARIVHPSDLNKLNQYKNLKRKTYSVKLRVVGNSHAVSIPKEIVDFINDSSSRMKSHMNDMVSLCFEDFGKLSLNFLDEKEREARWQRTRE
ncbi:hypothetical protein HY450_00670 [Candidatus Pacearchaeota archaeon]|nr:hypothetical protein [Candidatus Pacearchaeota archaeon]